MLSSGHLGFKTAKLCVLICEKETDTPSLFNSTHILINHLLDMQSCNYLQDLFSKNLHFGVTKRHSVGFLYAEFLETLFFRVFLSLQTFYLCKISHFLTWICKCCFEGDNARFIIMLLPKHNSPNVSDFISFFLPKPIGL